MCGILFTMNRDTYAIDLDDYVKDAFLANQVRGTDSTGLVVVGKEGMSVTCKMALNATDFVETKAAHDIIATIPRARAAIGHVRAATVGSVTAANAHPFKVYRKDGTYIVGVHNGTLVDWKLKKNQEKFTVDSEWAMHMLATEGHDAFEYFKGAFAFVWYDSAKPDSFFMARNEERPLHYMIAESGSTILGASELGMLAWLAERNKFKAHKLHPTPYYLQAGKIYEFSLLDIGDYKMTDYPKHDALTSKSTAMVELRPANDGVYKDTGYVPVGYGGSHGGNGWLGDGRYSTGYQDTYGIDDEWDGYYGGTTMETVLTDVKEALRTARYTIVPKDEDDELATEEDLTKAIMDAMEGANVERALVEAAGESAPWPATATPFDEAVANGNLFMTEPLAKTVTKPERENATTLNLFGMVVKFVGTWYDEELMACSGYYTIIENGIANTYDGEIRNIKKSLADDLYINRREGEGELCVVVGVHSSIEWMMLEPVTWQQRKELEEGLPYNTARYADMMH